MSVASSFLSRNLLSAAMVCGSAVAFVGYCIYFDHKRRSHPDYKKKLRERRKQQRQAQKDAEGQYPDLGDINAVQRFLMENMNKGDECISLGDIEKGIEHFANVVAVCPQPEAFLQIIRDSLPPQVFLLILQKVPEVKQKLFAAQKKGRIILQAASSSPVNHALLDDDVE